MCDEPCNCEQVLDLLEENKMLKEFIDDLWAATENGTVGDEFFGLRVRYRNITKG